MGLLLAAVLLAQNADGLTMEPRGSVRHPSAVTSIALAPDSSMAAVGLDDGTVLLYRLADRTAVPLGFRSYSGVSGLAFHPEGRIFALATRDGRLAIYDSTTWKEMKSGTVPSVISQIAFAKDGSSLFATQMNGHLIKISTPALQIERDIFPTDGSLVGALACSPDGKLVATTDREGHVKTWSTSDLSPVGNWQAHKGFIQALTYHPSGEVLASGGDDHAVKVWASGGSLVREDDSHHSEGIRALSFAPDGRLVSGGHDGLCQFWKAQTFEPGDSLPNYRGFIRASAISQDGKWLVRGGSALDFVPLDRPGTASRVHEYGGAIVGLAAKADAKRFVTASLDRSLILWSLEAGVSARTVPLADWATAVALSPDGKSVIVGLGNGRIERYSWETGGLVGGWPAHEDSITSIACIGNDIASAGWDSKLCLWTVEGKLTVRFEEPAPVRCLAADPRGTLLAAGCADGEIRLYDIGAKHFIRSLPRRPFSVTALAFTSDGGMLAGGYFDGSLSTWTTEAWEDAGFKPGEGQSLLSLDVDHQGALLAAGYRDGKLRLFDPVSLETAATVESRTGYEAFGVRFVLEDGTIAVAGADHTVWFHRLKGDLAAWIPGARERAAAAREPKTAAALVKRGKKKGEAGDLDGAIQDYSKALEKDGFSVEAYFARAQAEEGKGDLDGLIRDCTKVIELEPKHVQAYRLRGNAFVAKEDLEQAITDLTLAVEYGPRDPENYKSRADAYAAKDLKNNALADYLKVARLGSAQARIEAVEQIGGLGLRDAAEDVAALLTDSDGGVRGAAAYALARLEVPDGAKFIAGILADSTGDARGMALLGLGLLRAKEYQKDIAKGLKDPEGIVRGYAAWALGRIQATEYLEIMVGLLKGEGPEIRADVALALGELGSKSAIKALAPHLKDADPKVRGCAAWAVGRLEAKELAKEIAGLLDDEEEVVIFDDDGRIWVSKTLNDIALEVLTGWGLDPEEVRKDVLSEKQAKDLFEKSQGLRQEGKHREALEGYKRIARILPDSELGRSSAYAAACAQALLGEKEECLDWLERAVTHGYSDLGQLEKDPDLDAVRGSERYLRLQSKLKKER